MQKSISWFGIGFAMVTIVACAHRANPHSNTSGIGDDSPRTVSGDRIGPQNSGSEGPVADYSRLAINHRDVAAREARDRARLAATLVPATQVTDTTILNQSAPVVSEPSTGSVHWKKHKKPVNHVAQHKMHRDQVRMHAAAPETGAPEAVLVMKRQVALNELHHVNQKEIRMAKLASERTDSPALKYTAAKIEADHHRLDLEVEKLAKKRGVKLASFRTNDFQGVLFEKMKGLAGPNFDYAYRQEMHDGNRITAAQLRILRTRVGDAQIITLIDATIPVVTRQELHQKNTLSSLQTSHDYSAQSR